MGDKTMKIKSKMFYNFKEEEFGGKKYYVSRCGFGYDEDVILKSNDWILL